jgi:hypothetical protein
MTPWRTLSRLYLPTPCRPLYRPLRADRRARAWCRAQSPGSQVISGSPEQASKIIWMVRLIIRSLEHFSFLGCALHGHGTWPISAFSRKSRTDNGVPVASPNSLVNRLKLSHRERTHQTRPSAAKRPSRTPFTRFVVWDHWSGSKCGLRGTSGFGATSRRKAVDVKPK